jgi:EAL domain-containing protein (putative c-di-GMP-specific phosphodiesterase class I)
MWSRVLMGSPWLPLLPSAIDPEITESLVMEGVEQNIRKLKEIRTLGLEIAIRTLGERAAHA